MSSFYDRALAWPAGPPLGPDPLPPAPASAPRRAPALVLDQPRHPATARPQLERAANSLRRELRQIQQELATVEAQLAQLPT